ncbi:MAG: pyrimidine dimer DNA glycosylase/endonuclease V [Candidatus Thiodiazotropha sp. (ex Notomyrtea botanica)]|nr:pyrimidine dimer DNA glycosylase/endonuclease V [Candidatus Thiodiazotropha sp. (ex Notomyrtea botanica)]
MRLWSIHPRYLDAKGLVALWREALLAQTVLLGKTVGYKHHPQLNRFKETRNPEGAIASYLRGIEKEAKARGYNFDKSKINGRHIARPISVTSGQIKFEFSHLKKKLKQRDREKLLLLTSEQEIALHPLFEEVSGKIERWEIQ